MVILLLKTYKTNKIRKQKIKVKHFINDKDIYFSYIAYGLNNDLYIHTVSFDISEYYKIQIEGRKKMAAGNWWWTSTTIPQPA